MKTAPDTLKLVKVTESEVCCTDDWEQAYLRFETPEQEIQKFAARLRRLGAEQWPRDAKITELFCGRGNGLRALAQLGFTQIEGADLSASLISQYTGPGRCYLADCRKLPFESKSKDIIIIQGGLHHLPALPDDLAKTLCEIERVLTPGGRLIIVEPWLTPFLRLIHGACGIRFLRRIFSKLDALAIMIENERVTYDQWLGNPAMILALLNTHFAAETSHVAFGKLMFCGRKADHGGLDHIFKDRQPPS